MCTCVKMERRREVPVLPFVFVVVCLKQEVLACLPHRKQQPNIGPFVSKTLDPLAQARIKAPPTVSEFTIGKLPVGLR